MAGFVAEGGEDGVAEVLFDGFAVALVEVAGPVVGGALGAHVVACSGERFGIRKRLGYFKFDSCCCSWTHV